MSDISNAPLTRGRALRYLWPLDWSKLTVNHGSFGAAPLAVLEEQDRWRGLMEAQPTYFMGKTLPGALRSAADALARFVGADGKDLVFVDNATTAINAVLGSLPLGQGDEILTLTDTYGAVVKTARHIVGRCGAKIVTAAMTFPDPDYTALLNNIDAAFSAGTKLAIIDHITSPTALVLPVAEIIALCHSRGVPVLIDGAHAPGHLPLDLTALDADWYVGNCHKWLMSAKGAGFLWSRPDRQAGLHPTVISHGYEDGYLAEFDWTGTRDPSAYLTVPAAIAFHNELGGVAHMQANRDLAWEAAERIAERFGTRIGAGRNQHCAMSTVLLPDNAPRTPDEMHKLRSRLLDLGCDAQLTFQDGKSWMRLSVQAYNELEDFDRVASLILKTLA
ncbi:MAG TPA: aminotransferase class V-fold PLP-dependent enzyme [Arsenicitalea sp.]|jgi:isopenicillin-N epimerase|nr:aminotransferase class V-fold PLP-dependent enzyme [Arsenicitalea sp.]